MIAHFDHLVAMLVTGVIVLMLVVTYQRAQQNSVERAMTYVAKKQLFGLADMLERDLSNAGFGTTPGQAGITAHSTGEGGVTDTLAFWGSNAAGTPVEIRYVTSAVDSVTIEDETMPLFEIRRFERNGGAWVQAGGSTPTLTRFSVDLLNASSIPTNPAEARRVRVRFSNAVLPNVGPDGYLQGYRLLHWGITLTPANLDDYQGG